MAARPSDRLLPGLPYPMGATVDGLGVNFAVFSANATRIDLCLFDSSGRKELARLPLPECTDEVWHGYLPGAEAGDVYAFRAHGPYEPGNGHRFNPHKLLLDPYAKRLSGPVRWADSLFGYRLHHARADLSMDRRDSASAMAKAVVCDNSFNWGKDRLLAHPWSGTVIYEAHVRGVSMQRDGLQANHCGTFRALCEPRFIDHLLKLGITTLELLPVQAFLQDRFLLERKLGNYWGYSTLAYFAPEPAYLSTRLLAEMRIAVARLHAAGIEVILDVVYNHTCEGNQLGPTLSWRGLDNASYYRLVPGDERHYIDETGCGNTLNLSHPRVLQMVMDSLRYWVEHFHIDGFRFDLGVTLGREGTGFDPGSGFFDAIRQDPVLNRVKLISEPWDLGPGGYQLGNHPPGFGEWNDRYRDTVRRFWRGDSGQLGELAARVSGSADLFDRRRRKVWSSINFVAAHDGFTLNDVVSYAHKHNEANREDNRDGNDDNGSANWSEDGAVEGPTDDPVINQTRGRVQRAILATLLLSRGTPMLLGGDEFGRTQQGNNNAYCQDNPLSWFDWQAAGQPQARQLSAFVARLTALRRTSASLNAHDFPHGTELAPGIRDLDWFTASGTPMTPENWSDGEHRTFALRYATRLPGTDGAATTLVLELIFFNGTTAQIECQAPPGASAWQVMLESAAPEAQPYAAPDGSVKLEAHSVTLLQTHLVESPAS
ncbi:glycogen debranching enzyme GlgX [Burkholderia sp. WAC0059]|uniref:glycogen debranching protein GlgX n=1 Tax=Burkholderia sp. WAC0059 TaxID=2066022 RepID=UPI000C7EBC6E|nr:glycogen debranching protein GlgX [Burkholderia sp. WAC0059]PLZ00601.1 glycogen debranching enzyme GlgX [Burkholderia sp. WAC0059]